MKLCKDCKHYHEARVSYGMDIVIPELCSREISLVTGEKINKDCKNERYGSIDVCGKEGRFWEPK